MPYTDAPGFRMYYEEHGSGFPLLLINGLGSDHLEWLHQLPAFDAHFRVVVFDNRGTGMTDVPPGPYTTAQMADDAASLLRALGIARAHVLGVSLGGMIAQEVALRHPDRVDGLVLGCTGPGGELSVRPSPEAMAAFALAKGEDPEAELRRMLPFLYTDACIRERPGEIEGFVRRRLDHPTPPEGYLAQLSAAVTHDASSRLEKIRARTLVITGDADRLVNWENSLRLAGTDPGSEAGRAARRPPPPLRGDRRRLQPGSPPVPVAEDQRAPAARRSFSNRAALNLSPETMVPSTSRVGTFRIPSLSFITISAASGRCSMSTSSYAIPRSPRNRFAALQSPHHGVVYMTILASPCRFSRPAVVPAGLFVLRRSESAAGSASCAPPWAGSSRGGT